MRIILAAIALALAVACSNEGATPEAPAQVDEGGAVGAAVDVTAGEAKTIEEMQAESLAAVDQEACAAAGGAVRREGMLGMYRCVIPYADAGKQCRSSDECQGKCLVNDDAAVGDDAVGACQANDSPFGCYAEIEDGKVTTAICVD
ncbi:MAG TPA: hypothetical protein PKH09_14100 [Parvularculaceae bacterium]|nr:hypothetical protein [Parvularculaceae bacterium]